MLGRILWRFSTLKQRRSTKDKNPIRWVEELWGGISKKNIIRIGEVNQSFHPRLCCWWKYWSKSSPIVFCFLSPSSPLHHLSFSSAWSSEPSFLLLPSHFFIIIIFKMSGVWARRKISRYIADISCIGRSRHDISWRKIREEIYM